MIIPFKLRVRSERLPVLTLALIVLNVAAFVGTSNGLVVNDSAVDAFALTMDNVSLFRLVSCSFLHGDILHLLGNMWFLWLYGRPVEGRLGYLRFLPVYFLGDFLGSGLHLLMTQAEPSLPSLGASGGVMSLMGAAAFLFPFSRVGVFYWLSYFFVGTWEVRVWVVVLGYFVLDLVFGLLGSVGVANFAHVGGAVGGLAATMLLGGKRDSAEAGEAMSVLDEVQDFRGLTRSDLMALHRNRPEDMGVLLALVRHDVVGGRHPDPSLVDKFVSAFPAIERTVPASEYTGLVEVLGASTTLPASVHLGTGRAADREGDYGAAQRAYSRALSSPGLSDSDAEFAVFKLAQLLERTPDGWQAALQHYRDHGTKWPMSTLNGQVRSRISALERG